MEAQDKGALLRIRALRRFALAITILNILGHTVLGFEQSYAQPLCCLLTTYSLELLLEYVGARREGKSPAFLNGGMTGFVNFLLPAHISGLAVGMLLYASDRILPFVCAATIAICSKALFRLPTRNGLRHFFNPSNLGITVTLLLFPSVGIAPPYMFTEGLGPVAAVVLPLVILTAGLILNARLTRRIPLILAWLGSFIFQAIVRGFTGDSIFPTLNAMTGIAFILFTCYMIADPATTPSKRPAQVMFGFAVGSMYGVLVMFHVVFGLFFALTFVCLARGLGLAYEYAYTKHAAGLKPAARPVPAEATALPSAMPERLHPA